MKPVNRILAFDVSNNSCSVAISAGQKILVYREDLRPSMQAEILILLIDIKNLDSRRIDDFDFLLPIAKRIKNFSGREIVLNPFATDYVLKSDAKQTDTITAFPPMQPTE